MLQYSTHTLTREGQQRQAEEDRQKDIKTKTWRDLSVNQEAERHKKRPWANKKRKQTRGAERRGAESKKGAEEDRSNKMNLRHSKGKIGHETQTWKERQKKSQTDRRKRHKEVLTGCLPWGYMIPGEERLPVRLMARLVPWPSTPLPSTGYLAWHTHAHTNPHSHTLSPVSAL